MRGKGQRDEEIEEGRARERETDGRRVEEGRTTTYEQRSSTGGYRRAPSPPR